MLVLVSNEQTCRQLTDVAKFGWEKFAWMLTKAMVASENRRGFAIGPEPSVQSMWNPVNVVVYDSQLLEKDRLTLLNQVKETQKKAGRDTRSAAANDTSTMNSKKRRSTKKPLSIPELDPKQPKLVNFGILRYSSAKKGRRSSSPSSSFTNYRNNASRSKRIEVHSTFSLRPYW